MNGSNDEMLRAAAEQFGDKTVDEIMFGELQIQCDQMARLFFQYTTMNFCPKAYKKSQSGFTLCQTLKKPFKCCQRVLNWRNFSKSGHTGYNSN